MYSVHSEVKIQPHSLRSQSCADKRFGMGSERTINLDSPAATAAFGRVLAAVLRSGDVVLLSGDLGAGKTSLARAVIEALCGIADAPSPTYTIVQVYDRFEGGELWHADLYRVERPDELDELGFDDAFDHAVTLVEWPDRLGGWLPASRLEISITMSGGPMDMTRQARITGVGEWESRIDDLGS